MAAEGALEGRLPQHPRILLARLDSLGDCVLSTGFLAGLRQLFPTAHLTGAFSAATAALFEPCPLLDRVVAMPVRPGEARRALLEPPYDLAICPRWDVDCWSTRQLALWSGAPIRVGFDRGPYRYDEPIDGWCGAYFTDLVRTRGDRHEVLKSQDLLHFLGASGTVPAPRLWLPAAERAGAAEFLRRHGIGRFAVLAVAAQWPNRIWPVENFLPVIDALYAEQGLRAVIIGAEDAAASGEWLRARRPDAVVCATGSLTLLATAALTARAELYVGMDTGPMHLAAAQGVPVVAISCHPQTGRREHPNSPARFGPYATRHHVLQPAHAATPCVECCSRFDVPHCITGVTHSAVIAAARDLLAEAAPAATRQALG